MRTRPTRLRRSLARSRETRFTRPNRRACSQANWAPEVAFGPFRALSSRQLTFPFCCFQLNQPNYIDRDDVIRTTTAVHDFSFLFQVRILQFKKKWGKRNVCCLYLNDAIVKIVHHVRFVKVLNFFVV